MADDNDYYNKELKFTFGLVHCSNKYLTAEKFGFKVNAEASSMKLKQIWSLEQEEDGSVVYFKSHLQKYLGTDKNGKVSCDADTPGPDQSFQVEATSDGKWAIKNATHGLYFGGSGNDLDGFAKTIDGNRLWVVHLAMHPQINLYCGSRKRYAHLNKDAIEVSKSVPWGVETLITLVYKDKAYGLMTSDNRYLNNRGELSGKFDTKSTAFTLEFYAGAIAFKSKADNNYLSAQGPHGQLKAAKKAVGKDEKFKLKDSHPQVTLWSNTRSKFVSTRQGVQVLCNQFEAEESETFQMEYQGSSGRWCFRDSNNRYFTADGGVIMSSNTRSDNSYFDVKWGRGNIQLTAASGNPVTMKSGGNLLVKDGCEPEKFVYKLINRPVVVFRGDYGFIGHRAEKLEGNRATYDIYEMEENEGLYAFKGNNGRYWKVESDGSVTMGGTAPEYFCLELRKHTLMAIKSEKTGGYIKSDNVGIMSANGSLGDKATLWEY